MLGIVLLGKLGLHIDVASRTIVWSLDEQVWSISVPLLYGLHGRLAFEGRLRQLLVVQCHVTHQGLLQVLSAVEAVCFEDVGNASVEAFDHAVGLRCARFGQAVFDAQVAAQHVELVLARGLTFAAGKEPVGEFFAVVGQDFLYPDGAGLVQGTQEGTSTGRRLVVLDLHKYPARGAVYGHKQVAPAALVGHLRQVLDVDVQETGLIGLERLVRGRRCLGLERIQIAHTVAAQAAVEPRAGRFGTNINQAIINRNRLQTRQAHA